MPDVLLRTYFYFSTSVYLQMATDTEGALGKTKGKERESKLEKVVKKDRPGMIWETNTNTVIVFRLEMILNMRATNELAASVLIG